MSLKRGACAEFDARLQLIAVDFGKGLKLDHAAGHQGDRAEKQKAADAQGQIAVGDGKLGSRRHHMLAKMIDGIVDPAIDGRRLVGGSPVGQMVGQDQEGLDQGDGEYQDHDDRYDPKNFADVAFKESK